MRGIGWIVILAALGTVTYLVVRDLDVLQGNRGERTVIEPLEQARETVDLVNRTHDALKKSLDNIDK